MSEYEPKAPALLQLLSVLGPHASEVPLRRLPISELGAGVLGPVSEAELARVVNALVVHGLIRVVSSHGETALRLHPLVSETVRAGFGEPDLPLVEEAERLLAHQREQDLGFELRAHSSITELYLRLRFRADPAVIDSVVSGARSLMLLHFTDEALGVLENAAEEAVDTLGASHPATLRARHAIGDVLRAQERIEEAEAVYRSVHRVREESLGPAHAETLSTRHQLALMAGLRGDLDAAEEGFRAVWEAQVETTQEDHATALQALENLAYVRMLRGDLDAAEEGFQHVLRVRRRVLGPRHPVTVASEFYVARNAFERGDYRRAEEWFGRAVTARARLLGDEHPTTLSTREWWEKSKRQLRRA